MSRHVLHCDCCGYPLVAPWDALVIVCEACGSQSIPGKPGEPVPAYVPADGRPRLNLGGRSWVLEGRLASGDSSEVYRARWVTDHLMLSLGLHRTRSRSPRHPLVDPSSDRRRNPISSLDHARPWGPSVRGVLVRRVGATVGANRPASG